MTVFGWLNTDPVWIQIHNNAGTTTAAVVCSAPKVTLSNVGFFRQCSVRVESGTVGRGGGGRGAVGWGGGGRGAVGRGGGGRGAVGRGGGGRGGLQPDNGLFTPPKVPYLQF